MVKKVWYFIFYWPVRGDSGKYIITRSLIKLIYLFVFDTKMYEKRCMQFYSRLTIPTIRSSALLRINSSLSSRHCKIISLNTKITRLTIVKAIYSEDATQRSHNIILLPTLFNVVNNIVQHCWTWISPQSGVTMLNNIVDNIEQCGQHNIVQGYFHQPWTGCAFLPVYTSFKPIL